MNWQQQDPTHFSSTKCKCFELTQDQIELAGIEPTFDMLNLTLQSLILLQAVSHIVTQL